MGQVNFKTPTSFASFHGEKNTASQTCTITHKNPVVICIIISKCIQLNQPDNQILLNSKTKIVNREYSFYIFYKQNTRLKNRHSDSWGEIGEGLTYQKGYEPQAPATMFTINIVLQQNFTTVLTKQDVFFPYFLVFPQVPT